MSCGCKKNKAVSSRKIARMPNKTVSPKSMMPKLSNKK